MAVGTYLVPGKRTPFVGSGAQYSGFSSSLLARQVVSEMVGFAHPDIVFWDQVIPDINPHGLQEEIQQTISRISNQKNGPYVSGSTNGLMSAINAIQMLGSNELHLALIGGSETGSHIPIGLKPPIAQKIQNAVLEDDAISQSVFKSFNISCFETTDVSKLRSSVGGVIQERLEHEIDESSIEQQILTASSHANAIGAQSSGFFDDLIVPFAGVTCDKIPNVNIALDQSAVFASSSQKLGVRNLSEYNSASLADGAAGVWIADKCGLARLKAKPGIKIIDWQMSTDLTDFNNRIPSQIRAISRVLLRQKIGVEDIALWEIQENSSQQLLATIRCIFGPSNSGEYTPSSVEFEDIAWNKLNPNGGSLALGNPFGATGARILSQAAKELSIMPIGSNGIALFSTGDHEIAMILRHVEE
ncbi:hypothetical protein [Sphingorhabdus sp. EL138]|uniref:thiolase family protein n=1 Tax=Sphingorhabdus sp. EL138 TaxID=2073156 RepID=UPI000D69D825|nr:hypothetical protein [Sphingorhabdus sp. EL138]